MTSIISCHSAVALPFPDDSIDCIVTSPPYNVGVEYDGYFDQMPWGEYINDLVRPACAEMARVLVPGGRCWVNVPPAAPIRPNENLPERVNLGMWWASALYETQDLCYRDTIVWKQDSHSGGCAWGSWLSPAAPNTRGEWENMFCYFKQDWQRVPPAGYVGWEAPRHELGGDWTELCRNVWSIQPARTKWSPAPFPLDLPARAIRLSTWPGQTVLDPFGGGGTTAEAANILGRVGISLDISPHQTAMTHDRLNDLFS